ncbi:MAG: choice-of-anchor P family protein [Solirubrobacteraceae bacterium]
MTPVGRPIGGCLLVGGLALFGPGRPPLVIGPVAQAPGVKVAGLGAFSYPADGSIATASAVNLRANDCGGSRPASGSATVQSLSLFGGEVTAQSVQLDVRDDKPGQGSAIGGLTITGNPVSVQPGLRLPIASWGYAVALAQPSPAPGEPRSLEASTLAVHVVVPHAGLAAGTVLLVSFTMLPPPPSTAPAKRVGTTKRSTSAKPARTQPLKRKSAQLGKPLKVTPPLGLSRYVFPVVGVSGYGDSYGAFRSDVAGNWHHGDDIFAALGTPLVAVASGTVNRVGWESIGGWRLWVRDSLGNEFYYAHLSGYAPAVLHSNRVSAGEVVGFIGNTGDAFTTSPHLHFEVHPHTLLHLHYDGAVDPTTYLDHWTHLRQVRAPRPGHPPLPMGAVRQEARYVFRELLAARHLITHAPKLNERPQIDVPGSNGTQVAPRLPSVSAAALTPARHQQHGLSPLTVALLAPLGALALLALTISAAPLRQRIARRQSRRTANPPNT